MMGRAFAAALAVSGFILMAPTAVHASCIPQTEEQQSERADVIFVGVASEGATETGIQRFQVERYLKGSGPASVRVATGIVARADGTGSVTSVSLVVAAGERWRIYATRSADAVLETSVCAGSVKLGATEVGASSPQSEVDGDVASDASDGVTRAALLVAVVSALGVTAAVAIRRRPGSRARRRSS